MASWSKLGRSPMAGGARRLGAAHAPRSPAARPQSTPRCRAVPQTQTKTEGLIFTAGDAGAWDQSAVGNPVVRVKRPRPRSLSLSTQTATARRPPFMLRWSRPPVLTAHCTRCLLAFLVSQVRCYVGDDENRWYMWYNGRGPAAPALDGFTPASGSIGVAVSSDGINWRRGQGAVTGARGVAGAGGGREEEEGGRRTTWRALP